MLDISPAQARTLILDALAEYIEADIGPVPVEDARATKLPLSQCKAKDPNNCPYHRTGAYAKGGGRGYRKGQTFIPDDMRSHLEDLLAGEGIAGTVAIVEDPKDPHRFTAKFACGSNDDAEDAAAEVEQGFFMLPGITQHGPSLYRIRKGNFEVPFSVDADNEDLGADVLPPAAPKPAAKPAAKTPAPAPTVKASPTSPAPTSPAAPAPAAEPPQEEPPALPPPRAPHPRLRPPVAPPDPGKIEGLDADDIAYLRDAGQNLSFLAYRVNHNIDKGSPGSGSRAGQEYQGMKTGIQRLRDLAKKHKGAARLEKMWDMAVDSENAGWTKRIEDPESPWDPSKYISGSSLGPGDVNPASGYAAWGFDPDRMQGYAAWSKAAMARAAWVDPAKERAAFMSSLSDAPQTLVDALKEADGILSDIEKNMPAIDEAVDREKDPVAKAWLEDARAAVEEAYHDAKKAYEEAVEDLRKYATANTAMKGSIADTIAHLKAVGQAVPIAMENWQKCIDAQKKTALSTLARRFSLSPQELAAAETIYRKNMAALTDPDKSTIASIDDWGSIATYMMTGQNNTCGSRSDYSNIVQDNFGMKGTAASNLGKSFAFCRPVPCEPGEFPHWWSKYGRTDVAMIMDTKKAVLSVTADLYDGGSKYGVNMGGSCTSLMTDASLVSAVGEHISRDALTKDLTNLPRDQFLAKMGMFGGTVSSPSHTGIEVLAVGGINLHNCKGLKFFGPLPAFTPQQKGLLVQNGITVYDQYGKEVPMS